MPVTNTLALALWQPRKKGVVPDPCLAWPGCLRTDIQDTPELALSAAMLAYPGHDVLLVQTNLAFPPGFLSRMLVGWRQYEHVEVLSPLGAGQGLPVPAMSAIDIDAMQFLYGEHAIRSTKHWARHGSLWRSKALVEVFSDKQRSITELNFAIAHGVFVGSESAQSNPDHHFIGDGRPVLLHVLHSWGGGIENFARDLRAGDSGRHHLFLKADNLDSLPPFGKQLSLYHSGSELPLQTWRLDSPIDDTAIHSDEVEKILQAIIGRWGVGAIIVSSLIGHSMNVLKTGLPTVFACHDVYPWWPLLHDTRLSDEADFSTEYLAKFLSEDSGTIPFKRHSADYWMALKDHLAQTILDRNISCIAPSNYARNRLCAIEKKLRHADWRIISHGTIALDRVNRSQSMSPKKKLRVLVPGYMDGDKGETLLVKLLPDLPPNIELILLGCAARIHYKFQHEAVTCNTEYQREELSAWVEKIQPDMALLPSLVPETFGYVLSEMLAIGLPVLCANIGAYAERAKSLHGVIAVAPNAQAFIEKLVHFRDSRNELDVLAQSMSSSMPTLTDMAQAWEVASVAKSPHWFFDYPETHQIQEKSAMDRKIDQLIELSIKNNSLQQEQQRRYAESIDQLLASHRQLSDALEKLQAESILRHQDVILGAEKLEQCRENETRLTSELLQQRDRQIELLQQLQQKEADYQQLNQQTLARMAELDALYKSSSWTMTAPLRKIKTWFLR